MKNPEPQINYHGINMRRSTFIAFIEQMERSYINGSSFDGNPDKPVAKDLKAKIDYGYKLLNFEPGTIHRHVASTPSEAYLKVAPQPIKVRHKNKRKNKS